MPNALSHQHVSAVGFTLWNPGFRPFYRLAGIFAALSVLGWVAQLAGWSGPLIQVAGPLWHLAAVVASGLLWAAAFVLFVPDFWPILLQPRIDGRSWQRAHCRD